MADRGKKAGTFEAQASAHRAGSWAAKVGKLNSGWKAGEGHQEGGDMAAEADRDQNFQDSGCFPGSQHEGKELKGGMQYQACLMVAAPWLLWSRLPQERVTWWNRKTINRGGRGAA